MADAEPVSAADAFGLIANETRMGIIEALAEAPYEEFGGVLSFSELRRRTGVRDSGQFNYHLEKLLGQFIEEDDGGYTLTYAGTLLYRTVVAGYFNHDADLGAVETDSTCWDCEVALEGSYEDNRFKIECPACGRQYQDVEFPPSGVDTRSGADLVRAFDQFSRHQILLMGRDVCRWCGGPFPGEMVRQSGAGLTGERETELYVRRVCEHCGGFILMRPGENVLYHPAVVSFYHEHGVDITSRPLWEIDFVATDARTTVVSEDPWEVELAISEADDELVVVLDGAADVVEVRE